MAAIRDFVQPGPTAPSMEGFRQRVLALVCAIPPGRVATYGQIAALAGTPRRARFVGQVLAGLHPGESVPWQRVINAQGQISARGGERQRSSRAESRQERLLRAEGVTFRLGRVDLSVYRWRPEEEGFDGSLTDPASLNN